MKFALKTYLGWVRLEPNGDLGFTPLDQAPALYETFELVGLDPKPVPPVPVPVPFDPNVRQPWPRPMPADIDTTDENEVINRVDWCLQNFDSSDDRSYWVDVVQGRKEHLAIPGWTADGYWRTEKMSKADGNGHGYVWPPK